MRRIRLKKRREQKRIHTLNEIVMTAPETFDIHMEEHRHSLLEFIKNLQKQLEKPSARKIVLDFRQTKKFVVTGTLLFFARLSHLMGIRNRQITLKCKPPRNSKANQVLEQIGVYKLCGYHFTGKLKDSDVVHWQVARGTVVDAKYYAHTIEKHEGSLAEPLVRGVFRGMAEAMTNVMHHAYMDTGDGKSPPKNLGWWVFSQDKDGYLSVAMCDLGIGIPKTLPRKFRALFNNLLERFGAPTDAQCIVASVEESKSRTRQRERGKGLGDIIAAAGGDGTVMIHSNKGCYVSERGRVSHYNYKNDLEGTLVFWSLPLAKEN